MRMDPSVPISMNINLTEPQNICGINVRKDTIMVINIWQLHHNAREWIEPEKYIPERFDPSSKYFLTPAGNKRSSMSYGPYLGGKRICLGKTFADLMVKFVLSTIFA